MRTSQRQCWDPASYTRDAGFVSELGAPVVDLLAPQPGERILDLGCGDGALTLALVRAGAHVVGVDASQEMVQAARERGLDARVADGERLDFDDEFDAVFSNAALHWMRDSGAVLAGVARALRPKGRFVGEMGGHGNIAAIHAALAGALRHRGIDHRAVDPWYFPTCEAFRRRLEAHRFVVDSMDLIPRPTRLPGSIGDWMRSFAGTWISGVPAGDRDAVIEEVTEVLTPCLLDEDGAWTADYVRLRFDARLSSE